MTVRRDVAIVLAGLEADNFLAFLAALGLLRCLDGVRAEVRGRLRWVGVPPMAELIISIEREPQTAEVVDWVVDGARRLAVTYDFDGRKRVEEFGRAAFRAFAAAAWRDAERARLVAALGSDAVTVRSRDAQDPKVDATPLCLIKGAGHQYFLDRLRDVVQRPSAPALERALFERWRYEEDKKTSLRWEPVADQRHAYQFGDPSEAEYKTGTVTGANLLAAIGVALLTSVPTPAGLAALGVSGRRSDREMVWPLVGVPTSLAGHLALFGHPALYDADRLAELGAYGVVAVARARRYQVEKYFNVERARLDYVDA